MSSGQTNVPPMKAIRTTMEIAVRFPSGLISKPSREKLANEKLAKLGDLRGGQARWSPDGQQVFYKNGRDLYIAKSDGTESRKLATPPVDGDPIFPSWSPDGSRIRFNMFDGAKNTAFLWEEAVDGTGLHPLLPGWKSSQWGGRWTPDGRYYIFLVGYFHAGGYTSDFWAIRETKSFFGKVDREPIQLTFGPLGFFPPVFSPDGKRLFTMGVPAARRINAVRRAHGALGTLPYGHVGI